MNKLMKITDGTMKRLEKKLLKVVEKEYSKGDGKLYCDIVEINISRLEGNLIKFVINYGRDSKSQQMNRRVSLYAGDGNLTFIAGQFYQAISTLED